MTEYPNERIFQAVKKGLPERYADVSEIGSGGMGAVYWAKDTVLDRMVAVKVLNSASARVQDIQRIQREATAAARLSHDNLVAVLDFGIADDGSPYLVMEYVEGPTLKRLIGRKGSLELGTALEILAQIASGLDHAHRHGVIHRDLKSANIVVTRTYNGRPLARVIDFGIARLEDLDETGNRLTRTNAIMGSPLFMSPEQVRGETADERSDIYSLGCIFFECLTGRTPFRGESAMETMRMHTEEQPPALSEAAARELPAQVENIIARSLAKAPDDRYQSMADLLSDIDEALAIEPVCPLDVNELTVEPEPKKLSALHLLAFIVVSAAIIGSAILGHQVWKQGKEAVSLRANVPPAGYKQSEVTNAIDDSNYRLKKETPRFVEILVSTKEALDWDKINSLAKHRPMNLELEESTIPLHDYERIAATGKIYGVRLINCNISDEILERLSYSKYIEQLSLDGSSGFTPAGLAHVQRMPVLADLNLTTTGLTDAYCEQLTPLKGLKRLDLKKNKDVGDRSIIPICKSLSGLKYLQLSFTGVTDAAMPTIASMKNLKLLMLGGTAITDAGISHLHSESLERVSLVDTDVTVRGVSRLTSLKGMKRIWLPNSISPKDIRHRGKIILDSKNE